MPIHPFIKYSWISICSCILRVVPGFKSEKKFSYSNNVFPISNNQILTEEETCGLHEFVWQQSRFSASRPTVVALWQQCNFWSCKIASNCRYVGRRKFINCLWFYELICVHVVDSGVWLQKSQFPFFGQSMCAMCNHHLSICLNVDNDLWNEHKKLSTT